MYEAFDSSSELPSGENRHREQVRALASVLFNGAHGSLTYAGHLVEAFWGIGSVECLHDISGQLRDILQYGQDEDDTVNMARLSACLLCNCIEKKTYGYVNRVTQSSMGTARQAEGGLSDEESQSLLEVFPMLLSQHGGEDDVLAQLCLLPKYISADVIGSSPNAGKRANLFEALKRVMLSSKFSRSSGALLAVQSALQETIPCSSAVGITLSACIAPDSALQGACRDAAVQAAKAMAVDLVGRIMQTYEELRGSSSATGKDVFPGLEDEEGEYALGANMQRLSDLLDAVDVTDDLGDDALQVFSNVVESVAVNPKSVSSDEIFTARYALSLLNRNFQWGLQRLTREEHDNTLTRVEHTSSERVADIENEEAQEQERKGEGEEEEEKKKGAIHCQRRCHPEIV